MAWMRYPKYVSVHERKERAKAKMKILLKKNPNMQPVIIEGRDIAKTWWGRSWNKNLGNYADYDNRMGRGRSYVRSGAVVDLRISPGLIEGQVLGSYRVPYKIKVVVKDLDAVKWMSIKKVCGGRFDSLRDLLDGNFPKSLEALLVDRENGLFPSPDEIEFRCNCPDWADMCKHVAAVLYGVGTCLDAHPELIFTLRNVVMDELLVDVIKDETSNMVRKSSVGSERVIEDSDLSGIFGIEFDETPQILSEKKDTATGKDSTSAKGKKAETIKKTVVVNKRSKTKKVAKKKKKH